MNWTLAALVGCLLLTGLIYRALLKAHAIRGTGAFWLFAFGALLAAPTHLSTAYVLELLGWALQVGGGPGSEPTWIGALALVAAAEQLVLVIVVWPAYRGHRLERLGAAWSAAGLSAAGFGVTYAVLETSAAPGSASLFLGLGAFVSRVFSVGLWSSCLSTSRARYKAWFPAAWLGAVLVDGFVRHLLQGRGAGWQVVALPPLICMATVFVLASHRLSLTGEIAMARANHGEAPRIEHMRAAFQHAHRPALVHWIFGGALVSFGTCLVGLAAGVLVAHWFGIDLSLVDETNSRAAVPLVVLGGGVLLSFPISGFLTAKASAADSLFEPGMSALFSIVALTVLLSRSAPLTLVLGLALAPLAFFLACVGAWFGLRTKGRVFR